MRIVIADSTARFLLEAIAVILIAIPLGMFVGLAIWLLGKVV